MDIPSGFAYCDGTNGTPDLRGRTLIGTGLWSDIHGTTTYNLGDSGGERLHKLTVLEMPSHSHGLKNKFSLNGKTGSSENGAYRVRPVSPSSADTTAAGGDQAHNTMMPYTAIHWIMKL